MKNYIKFATVCLMGIALASCSEKEYVYTPAEEDAVKVTLDAAQSMNVEADGNDFPVILSRKDASSDLTVKLSFKDPSGIFSLSNSTVTFAKGENTASASVSYDYDDLVKDQVYNIEVAIDDPSLTSNFGINVMPFSVIKAWKKLGTCQFYDAWFFGYVWEKELIQSPDGSETYRLLKPFTKEDIEDEGFDFNEEIPYLEFSIDEEGHVSYGKWFNLGFSFSGMTCAYASPLYLQKNEAKEAENAVLMPGLVQFCWYPILGYTGSGSYSWWGSTANAFLSFPDGPDLNELLGE